MVGSKSWLRRFYDANIDWLKFRIAIAGMDVAFGRQGLFWGLLWVQEVWQGLTDFLRLGRGRDISQPERPQWKGGDPMQEQVMVMAKDFGVEIDENIFRG
jgi:hypothetical protein